MTTHSSRPSRRRLLATATVPVLCAAALAVVGTVAQTPAGAVAAADSRFTLAWSKTLGAAPSPVALASPGVGVLDSAGTSVIVGTRGAQLWAFHTGNGARPAGWPISTNGVSVDTTPAVAGSGSSVQVFVGLGNAARPANGGLGAYNATGHRTWVVLPRTYPSGSTATSGVQTSPAVGTLATSRDVVAGSMGQLQYAVSSAGATLPGFPWFQGDANFSSPALNDVNGDGHDEIIEGGDSTAGTVYGHTYVNGGHIRIVKATGAKGGATPADATICDYQTNQGVQSSPAVGRFLAAKAVGIVVGTGTGRTGASDSNAVFAVDTGCHVKWRAVLDGASLASPSLVDVDQDGLLDVVTASSHGSTGTVYALDGATGHVKWSTAVNGAVYGQVTSIDIAGRRSLLVGNTGGVTVLDGATGAVTGQLTTGVGVQNTVAVTVDPGNAIGVTVVGYNGSNQGVALHYRLNGATATTVGAWGQWPMFHHDPQLRGVVTGTG